jgi:hypothetical protein
LLKQNKEEDKIAGRFEGLSDLEWKLFEDFYPNPQRKEGVGCHTHHFAKY